MRNLPQITERYYQMICEESRVLGNAAIPEIYTDKQSETSAERIQNELRINEHNNLICIIPSTRHFTKTYPAEYYIELINRFDRDKYSFLVAGKGEDRKNIEVIKKGTGSNVYDLCDKLNLLELTEVMKRCKLVISGDTGPMHIAEALGIPLIMIAGSSVKEFGFFPVSENSIVIENAGLKCRPCSHIGRDSCPLEHFKCMSEIRPKIVYEKIMEMVS